MTYPYPLGATHLKREELGRWQCNDTILVLLADPAKTCYTMSLVKNGKLISEASREDKDIGKLLVAMLDPVPIDPKYIKLI